MSYTSGVDKGSIAVNHISVSDLPADLSDAVNRAALGSERVVVQRRGKDLAAIVPLEDLALLEQLEDRWLLARAERVLADPNDQDDIPWEQVMTELGL